VGDGGVMRRYLDEGISYRSYHRPTCVAPGEILDLGSDRTMAAHSVSLSLLGVSFLEDSGFLRWLGVHLLERRCRLLTAWRSGGLVEALSGVMVTSMAGTTKIMLIFILGIARWFDGGDGFYIVCMRCSVKTY
jgi:hypothetical protein